MPAMRPLIVLSMRGRWVTALLVFGGLLVARDASAQDSIIVRALGVATVSPVNTTTMPLWGIGVGLSVTPIVQLTFEASREFGRDDPTVPPKPTGPPGVPNRVTVVFVESERIDRRVSGGVRFRMPDRQLTPFAEANVGVARFTVRYQPGGALPWQGGIDSRTFVDAGGGLSLSLNRRVAVEISYRLGKVVEQYNRDVFHSFGGGIGVGF